MNINKKVVFALLLAIIIAAFSVRFININNLPAGLYPDEAVNGMDALQANATGEYKLFYEANNGREGLFINLQALSLKLFGNTIAALKLWSAIFGTLTVLGVFLLTRELFKNSLAGLIGAYLMAFSYWAINFSRMGFRAIMVPFILTFAFYFLFRGLRTKKFHDFILAGLIYGLGLHTYIAFRVSPLVLVALLISLVFTRQNFFATYWKHILVFTASMFIAAMPMLLDFFYWSPHHYASRTGSISVLNPEVNQGNILKTVAKTLGLSLAKYNFWGDQNMRHNYPPYPLLNPLTGIAFLFGFFYIIVKFFHLFWLRLRKGLRDEKLNVYVLLLAWFFALLIPEVLANEGNPHSLRAIGTLPVVMIMAALPFLWVFKELRAFGSSFKIAIITLLIFSFSFIAIFDTVKYFVFFAGNPKQHEAYEAVLTVEAAYIRSLPSSLEKFVVAQSMQRIPIEFLDHTTPNVSYFYPGEIDQIQPKSLNDAVILMNDKDDRVISQLQKRFPTLKLEVQRNSFGDTFYVLKQ